MYTTVRLSEPQPLTGGIVLLSVVVSCMHEGCFKYRYLSTSINLNFNSEDELYTRSVRVNEAQVCPTTHALDLERDRFQSSTCMTVRIIRMCMPARRVLCARMSAIMMVWKSGAMIRLS